MIYDLIIIGGGPAGISAGIYAARKKIKTLLIAQKLGGQPSDAWQIENYPGFESISGFELAQKMTAHLKKYSESIEIKEGDSVVEINKASEEIGTKPVFDVKTEKEKYQAKSLIIASGSKPKKLNIPGEDKFIGKGVVFCATCDAPLFSGKSVAVVGSGNSGLDAALQLTKYARKIFLINKYADLSKADSQYVEQVRKNSLIEVKNNSLPVEIIGDKFVSLLIIKNTESNGLEELAAEGVFVEIGSIPNLHFANNLIKCNQKGEIEISPENNSTSCAGIFAAGDATNVFHKQIIIAAGEGAKAALGAYYYLIKHNIKSSI
jgi:thioredoxin-disulfide reductase